jgi:tetratricopeptide (TPR) repeat protein
MSTKPQLTLVARLGVALIAVMLAVPSLAVDSGGGDGGGGGGGGGSSGGGSSSSSSSDSSGPSLADARRMIKAENWDVSIRLLKQIVSDGNANADVYNLLGFSLRKSGDMKNALGFYLKALKLNPRHKGAHEYLGELYVETGDMVKAKEHLETLARLCGNTTCEEYQDLREAIEKAG